MKTRFAARCPLSFIFTKGLFDICAQTKNERVFQHELIWELKQRFPGCIVTKLDAGHIQGIPDLLVLWRRRWATLECKKSKDAPHQPNQDYYVKRMNSMSFSRFIYPENKEEVLNDLERAFKSGRQPRLSGSKQVSLDKL